ncbi:MiaB-like protein tRNA modifying enzyme [archaeon GW2011_AR15]|nr:MiaB-like protein tRNA modifying enzyme [archaeon GW2011_AR15]
MRARNPEVGGSNPLTRIYFSGKMKKIFIKTYGCSFNQADSENMAGLLVKSQRYRLVDSEGDADVVIINSCTVKNKAENKFWRDLKNIKKTKILAGCVPQAERDKSKFERFSVIGSNQINSVVEVVDETLSGNTVQLFKKESTGRLNIPKVRKNSIVEIVPINEGCLGSCNFCATKFSRGHLVSYQPEEIVSHIRNALNDGAKEIWLTSQDTACYGYDIGTTIVALLKKIFEMKRGFKVRLGMGNPDFLPDYLDELIEVFKDKRMFKFLHIPLQAGSDNVLKKMKRNYTAETFVKIIEKFRAVHPDITIATDIIVGYPGETREDFLETLRILEKTRPDVMNISRFWARPGTVAAKKKQLPTLEIKNRSIELTKLYHRIARENNRKWIGWRGEIIIDEQGKEGSLVGRNYAYKPVIVEGHFNIGEEIEVDVKKVTSFDLRAQVI